MEGRGCSLILDLLRHLPGGIEENHEKLSDESSCPLRDLNQSPPKFKHYNFSQFARSAILPEVITVVMYSRKHGCFSCVREKNEIIGQVNLLIYFMKCILIKH
jgi:hypothetical protein